MIYQGQQHEYAVDWFGSEEKFEIQKEFDKQKRDYANSHNINLLEIWYYRKMCEKPTPLVV